MFFSRFKISKKTNQISLEHPTLNIKFEKVRSCQKQRNEQTKPATLELVSHGIVLTLKEKITSNPQFYIYCPVGYTLKT